MVWGHPSEVPPPCASTLTGHLCHAFPTVMGLCVRVSVCVLVCVRVSHSSRESLIHPTVPTGNIRKLQRIEAFLSLFLFIILFFLFQNPRHQKLNYRRGTVYVGKLKSDAVHTAEERALRRQSACHAGPWPRSNLGQMNANQWCKQRTLGRSWSPQSHSINRYKFPILTKTKKKKSQCLQKNSKVSYISEGKQ